MVRVFALALLAACAASPEPGERRDRLIYGDDGRVDLQDASDPALARGLAALVPADRLTVDGDRVVTAPTTLAEVLGGPLCPGERFETESSLATCSAALVEPDVVMTAAHCVPSDAACDDLRIVFGYRREGEVLAPLRAADVHRCVERFDEQPELDRIRLRLDRASAREPYLPGRVVPREPVVVASHPAGGPALVEEGLFVRRFEGEGFVLYADLEDGSSGAPVLDPASERLLGIIVAGELDYEWNGECFQSRRRNDHEGEGVWATHAFAVSGGCSAIGVGAGGARGAGGLGVVSGLLLAGLFARRRGPRRSPSRGASAGCGLRRGS